MSANKPPNPRRKGYRVRHLRRHETCVAEKKFWELLLFVFFCGMLKAQQAEDFWPVCGCRSNYSLTRAMDGRILRCGIISSCQSAATSEIVKRFWSRTHVRSATATFTITFARMSIVQVQSCAADRIKQGVSGSWRKGRDSLSPI